MNHTLFAYHVQHSADQLALTYLEDVWVARDPAEPRAYTIEFVSTVGAVKRSYLTAKPFSDFQREPPLYRQSVEEGVQVCCPPCGRRGQARRGWHYRIDARLLMGA